jgi:hypothetical protein
MSHIVEIKTQVKDVTAARAACHRRGLSPPVAGTAKLFSGSARGLIVELPAWRYPVVFDTEAGTAQFDNFGGRWGQQAELDAFLQAYACERAKLEARRQGQVCTEQQLADGSIKLTISVGGGQ